MIFARRYTAEGRAVNEPPIPTASDSIYDRAQRTWHTYCRTCGDVDTHADEAAALAADEAHRKQCEIGPSCAVEWCPKTTLLARGMCREHYLRELHLHGPLPPKPQPERKPKKAGGLLLCGFEGCDHPFRAKGLCRAHWTQRRRGEQLRPLRAPRYRKKAA